MLVICGEKDNANKKAAKSVAEGIVTAKMQLVKKAGHEVNLDAPKELGEILNDFYHNLF